MSTDPLTAICRARIAALGHVLTLGRSQGSVGMRLMVLSPADVAALHTHITQPTALPTVPLRAVSEMEPTT